MPATLEPANDWQHLEVANSSNLNRVAYSAASKQLVVSFNSGRQWLYKNVDETIFTAMQTCAKPDSTMSVGKYFASVKSALTGDEYTGDALPNTTENAA